MKDVHWMNEGQTRIDLTTFIIALEYQITYLFSSSSAEKQTAI
jgi:hypothetical protein